MTAPSAIHTSGLAKSYGRTGSTIALHPTTLGVPHSSIFALLGHNGAGKTTLLKLVMNILHPTAGSATVLDHPSATLAGDDFASIGYVSENQELPAWMTVRAFLSYQSGFYPHPGWCADHPIHLAAPPAHRPHRPFHPHPGRHRTHPRAGEGTLPYFQSLDITSTSWSQPYVHLCPGATLIFTPYHVIGHHLIHVTLPPVDPQNYATPLGSPVDPNE